MLLKLTTLCAFFLFAWAPVHAQQSHKVKPINATGTVKNYEPGKSIEVEAKGAPHTYDLTSPDTTYTISPDIAVGTKVRLIEKTDATGHKTVTIESAGKPHKPAGEKTKTERPMSEKPPIPLP